MNRPLVKKPCPRCEGSGRELDDTCTSECELYRNGDFSECNSHATCSGNTCSNCNGTGEVWNYLQPHEWEAETGEKMLDSDPVWDKSKNGQPWELQAYWFVKKSEDSTLIVARLGQPRPPEGYRP